MTENVPSTRGRGRGRGRTFGRGRGRGQGRGRGSNNKRQRQDAWFINDTNGSRMEVHPSYRFNDEEWHKIPQPTQQQLIQMRNEYKRSRQSYSSQGSSQYPTSSVMYWQCLGVLIIQNWHLELVP